MPVPPDDLLDGCVVGASIVDPVADDEIEGWVRFASIVEALPHDLRRLVILRLLRRYRES